ncbi:hypothetical protein AAFP30_25720 [Gordonia sp. CPCC 205515]|uniref:hypothetical protein n=1 Tax=Gordonia sp. CPCC 205515 TaxID=3140791 RepID=UPI003AF35BDF
MMRTVRVLLIAAGVIACGYGAWMILHFSIADLVSVAIWLVLGLAVHDALFAPAGLVASQAIRRILPPRWARPILIGIAYTVVLVLLSLPVLLPRPAGERPDNATILDRPFGLGLALAIAAVWVAVAVGALITRRRRRPIRSPSDH